LLVLATVRNVVPACHSTHVYRTLT